MKTIHPFVSCFAALAFLPLVPCLPAEEAAAGADPFLNSSGDQAASDRGEVTIPYAEMKRIWGQLKEGHKEPEQARTPVDHVVLSADYTLDLAEGQSQLVAEYRVKVFHDEWQIIPLIGGEVRLDQAETNGGSIVRRDSGYALLVKGKGEYPVKLTLRAAAHESWSNQRGLKLQPAPATLGRLRVSGLPAGKAVRLGAGDGVGETGQSIAAGDFLLPGDSGEVTVLLEQAAKEDVPVLGSVWGIDSQVVVRYAEGRLHYRARIFAQSDAGSGLSMDLGLPQNVASVSVEGEDIASWHLDDRGKAQRKLHIIWKTRDRLDRRFDLSYQIPQSPLSKQWAITPPEAAGEGGAAKHLIAIETVEGLEWKGQGIGGTVASRRLPKWLREQLQGAEFVTLEAQGEVKIQAEWLPVLEALQATVSLAKFETRLVNDGAMLVRAEYHVQGDAALEWSVNIPAFDQILNCEVNGKAVKPVLRNENQIEFHLKPPKMESKQGGAGLAVVGFSYTLQSSPFDPVSGQVAVELPQTDLFIHRLDWDLEIPRSYETTAVEGNVQLAAKAPASSKEPARADAHTVRLIKELCRGERPAVELYYRRRGIDD